MAIKLHNFKFPLAALILVLLGSCAAPAPQTTADKQAELCTNLARLNTAIAGLKSISPNSTVGDFRAAQDQVKTAFGEVKASAQQVQTAQIQELEQAEKDLEEAVNAISDTDTMGQAISNVSTKADAVETAQVQVSSGLNCP